MSPAGHSRRSCSHSCWTRRCSRRWAADAYLEYRVGFELIAHSGRGPGEICNLAADCLRYEEEPAPDGGKQRRPVLRYLREKPPSKWLSLPINQDAAELIEAQQRRLQARFPGTKLGKLALLPRRKCNPTGRLPVISPTLSYRVSKWVRSIPTLLDEDGSEFSRDRVYLYALRHSYAQRHADAGVPFDTLQKLMDHRTAATTQIYYRVTWARKREAIERLAPLTMDRDGTPRRVPRPRWSSPSGCARRSAGSRSRSATAPSSTTSERSARTARSATSASAASTSAPTRRTSPTSTPTSNGCWRPASGSAPPSRKLAEWARTKAIPADAEIRTVRTLIRAGEAALDELQPGERAKLLELFRVLRATRARMDGTIGIEQVAGDPQPRADVHAARVHATAIGASAPRDRRRMSDRAASMKTAKRRDQQREARTGHGGDRADQRTRAATISSRRRSSLAVPAFTDRS